MSNNYFQFKQFTVYQDQCAMKVGTDGVLLGSWADVSSAHSILDIGTGTGLISLMMAQRSNAQITAIEIDPEAATQAHENFAQSPWSERIQLHNKAIQDFQTTDKFERIVSNPPYFNQSLKSPKDLRTMARHTDSLSYEELVLSSKRLLTDDGTLSVILPYAEKDRFIKIAENNDLYCTRLTIVRPTPTSTPKRFMAEFSLQNRPTQCDELIIEQFGRHQYSDAYKQLTKDFYLDK